MNETVTIDYENIPGQSNEIRGIAKELNNKLLNVYKQLSDMHQYWYGRRYNDLISNFNELVPQLNDFLDVIVSEVPYIFETIANNFSEIDINQNVTVAQRESVQKIQQIELGNDKGMRYIENEVEQKEKLIVEDLHNVIDLMERIERITEQVGIEYNVADEFKVKFRNLSVTFKKFCSNIEKQFVNVMELNRTQMLRIEKANKV